MQLLIKPQFKPEKHIIIPKSYQTQKNNATAAELNPTIKNDKGAIETA